LSFQQTTHILLLITPENASLLLTASIFLRNHPACHAVAITSYTLIIRSYMKIFDWLYATILFDMNLFLRSTKKVGRKSSRLRHYYGLVSFTGFCVDYG
jgi:hypothetical protein